MGGLMDIFFIMQSKSHKLSDIVTLLRNRDEKGLTLMYDRYAPTLLGIIVRIVKRRDIGEEVLQQSFLKAWDNIEKYNVEKGNFFTWLMTIARRTSIDQVRLAGYKYHTQSAEVDHLEISDESQTNTSTKLDVERLLQGLDDNKKRVLDLIYIQGHTQQDAAEILDIPLGTVKSRLRLAIVALRKELKEEKNLFLGLLTMFLSILTILRLWI